MEMPQVKSCDARECAYNRTGECHAHAITVGNSTAPHCDTFYGRVQKGGDLTHIAGVGACKSADCIYNKHLNCTAPKILVGHTGDEVVCLTYTPVEQGVRS